MLALGSRLLLIVSMAVGLLARESALEGRWQVGSAPVLPDERLVMAFGPRSFWFEGPCNRHTFTYQVKGRRFVAPPERGGMTLMLCPPAVSQREWQFETRLMRLRRYAYRDHDHLVLTTDAGDIELRRLTVAEMKRIRPFARAFEPQRHAR